MRIRDDRGSDRSNVVRRLLLSCAGAFSLVLLVSLTAPAVEGGDWAPGKTIQPGSTERLAASPAASAADSRPLRQRLWTLGFAISSVTPPASIQAGQSDTATVAVTRTGASGAELTLSIASNAQGITGSGTIASEATSGSLTINVPSDVAAGTYSLTAKAASASRVDAESFDLAVTAQAGSTTMSAARAYHSETLLPSGKVLLAGGRGSSSTFLTSADLYDPTTGFLTPTGSMATPRVSHTATQLANGLVLFAGGFTASTTGTTSAELYDPITETFSATGSLTRPRGAHTATLLPSGEVLIVGGYSGNQNTLEHYPTTCEIYDPATGQFRDSGSLNAARGAHRATLVTNTSFPGSTGAEVLAADVEDRVLISGGYSAAGFIKALEWYSVNTDSFMTLSVQLAEGRALHTAVALRTGKILLAGGTVDTSLGFATASAELYDVNTGAIASTGSLATKRGGQSSTVTTVNGKVLVCGGSDFFTVQASVESYDPATETFTTLAAPMSQTRTLHTATLLGNGNILIAGGAYAAGFSIAYRDTIELYTPPSP